MLPDLLTTIDPINYDNYLNEKISSIHNLLTSSVEDLPDFTVYKSTPEHYRMRVEFSVYHDDDGKIKYVMYEKGSKPRKIIFIEKFDAAHIAICKAMDLLKELICPYKNLKEKLFAVDFLTNEASHVIISLQYHKKLDEYVFLTEVYKLRQDFTALGLNVDIVGHAKGQSLNAFSDSVVETYSTQSGDIYLKQVEGTFTQPNKTACTHMLDFAISCAQGLKDSDLLELYCGSGTFTVTLAPYFRKVLATEVSRIPTLTALDNLTLNNIDNTKLVRLSAVEVAQALSNVREFKRLKLANIDINSYNFKTLLIDPPRAGLQDKEALDFTAKFDRVIYISCGPQSLASDLAYLTKTHKVVMLSFFDQFPYTSHLESGVLLIRK